MARRAAKTANTNANAKTANANVVVAYEKIPDEGAPERRGGYAVMAERRWQEGAVGAGVFLHEAPLFAFVPFSLRARLRRLS